MADFSVAKRHRARRAAVQAVYQWQLTGHDMSDIETQFLDEKDESKVDFAYFHLLVHGVFEEVETLDKHISSVVDRNLKELDPVELAIIRLAVLELIHQLTIPYKIIIDEALKLAKTYGATEGYKYVNAVLDKLARVLRPEYDVQS